MKIPLPIIPPPGPAGYSARNRRRRTTARHIAARVAILAGLAAFWLATAWLAFALA